MNLMGLQAGPCRLPLCDPDAANAAYIEQVLREYNLI